MLLIAQPKSSSTGLQYNIGKNGFKRIAEKDRKELYNVNCNEFLEMQKIFTTIYDLDSKKIWKMLYNRNYIYKKHILPTQRHLNIIDNLKIKFVLLLRDPESCIQYLISHKKNHKKIYSWDYDINKLRYDFNKFYKEWKTFSENKEYILTIYYKDFIKDYQGTMNKIFSHYGLRQRINYIMEKDIYYMEGEKNVINSST